jgi:hypothetical protein
VNEAGGQWHRPRMTTPARAARLGRAVAVAPRWLGSSGGVVDAAIPEATWPDGTARCPEYRRPRRATRGRLGSVLRRGGLPRLGALRRHAPVPAGCFVPAPWPAIQYLEEARCLREVPALPEAAEGDRQRESLR